MGKGPVLTSGPRGLPPDCWRRRMKERIARTLEQISFIQNEVRCSRLQNSVLKRIGIAPEVVIKCDPPILSFHNFAIRNYVSVFVNWKCS